MRYAPWIAAILAAALPAAYAQTVPVDGTEYAIEYSGDGVEVGAAVLDAIGSLDIDVTAQDDATLVVTVPSGVFGSADPSRIDVLVDFRPAEFEAEAAGPGIEVSIQLDVLSSTVQILYDDQGAGAPDPPAAEPPVAEPPAAEPPAAEPPRAEPEPPAGAAPPEAPAERPEDAANQAPTPAPEPPAERPEDARETSAATPPEPQPPGTGIVCGEGTYELDGACVASCGPGLVFDGGQCVAAAPPSGASLSRDLVYGTAAGFAVAFAALIVFWMMARASRGQQS